VYVGSPFSLALELTYCFSNAGGVIMGVAYGIEDESENDRYITVAERALKGMAMGAKPGGFLVEFLPFRMFLSLGYHRGY
jgi:hypothetical protein